MNNKLRNLPIGQAIVVLWTSTKTAVLLRKPQNATAYHACRRMFQECGLSDEQINGISFAFRNSRPASGFVPGHIRLLTTAEIILESFRRANTNYAKQLMAKKLLLPIIEIGKSGKSREERQEQIKSHIESCEGPDHDAAINRFICKAMLLSTLGALHR